MPILNVVVDLPDEAYRNATLLSSVEQNRVASIALTAVFAVAHPGMGEAITPNALTARYAQDANDSDAFYAQLSDGEKSERRRVIEAGSAAGDAGRVLDGDTMFARIRARHSAVVAETAE